MIKEFSMKNASKQISIIAIAIIAIGIIAGITACNNDNPAGEQPKVQPDTPRTLAFGTDLKVTIKSEDKFTDAEWTTLCDKAVAAIERGYGTSTDAAKVNIETYFTNNNVSVVLSKSATYDVETKSDVPKTIYFKANASVIDGITDANLTTALAALRGGGSYPTP
jgi:hypothetical protein